MIVAVLGVYLGASRLIAQRNADLGQGQFIENVADTLPDELKAGAGSTTESAPGLAGSELAESPIVIAAPSTDAVTTSTASSSSVTTAAPQLSETTASVTDPPTTADATPSSTETTPSTDPTTSSSVTAPPAGLSAVELEIFRLTNELRANPAGPLARQKAMPPCVNDEFYGITIDPATGHPTAVPALSLSEAVSLEMSRPWAIDMDSRDTMSHRPNESQLAIYEQLGIGVSAIGENVAWSQGYPDSQAAQVHFEGWRESDSGHYCALVSGTYTNIGVGHYRGAQKSWAAQNFYQPR
jgi:uncharacterized protein YkwD